jgi:UDP-N-acetylmuramoyl-L-alanyl-D-glutamate--2,6-diaminopimelate ligase
MANYGEAKVKLFALAGLEHAIINLDDTFGREIAIKLLAKGGIQVWGYTIAQSALQGFEKFGDRLKRIYAKDSIFNSAGYDSLFSYEGVGSNSLHIPVLGEFNLSNALAVWTALLSQGFSCDEASKRVSQLRPVLGRMELIQIGKQQKSASLLVVVDYAHTPDALQKTLQTLAPIAKQRDGKIWCVFGCGGDRDAGKRSEMGTVAQQYADHIIITSDNPRSEEPQAIIEMIRSGISQEYSNIQVITDRSAAIMAAVRHAASQDIVLVAGKGHETTQEINGKKFDFSDQEHIRLAAGGIA